MADDPLFEKLAAEEPPLQQGDTFPSSTAPHRAVRPGRDRVLSGVILLVALVLTVVAGWLIFRNQDDDNSVSEQPPTVQPTLTATVVSTATPTEVLVKPVEMAFLPTAAVDEAAVALLTPVPADSSDSRGVVQRGSVPFTQQSGEVAERDFINYVVQQGDTLDSIIERYGLTDICTLVWSNDQRKVSPLRPGNQLIVPPIDGVFAKIRDTVTIGQLAEETGVESIDIIGSPYNPYLDGSTEQTLLVEGMQVMVPYGDGGSCAVWSASPEVTTAQQPGTGADVTQTIRTYSLWGCQAQITGGGFPTLNPIGSGGYQFWQGFSSRHSGVDLAAATGTPLKASGLGTVIFAGWNNYGYGRTVVIAHGTTFTLYGHMDSISVSCGQNVSAGQVIGTVGSTGNSTGPHVHFEIRNANFDALDPCYTISC